MKLRVELLLVVLALGLPWADTARAQVGTVEPIDQAARDPDLLMLRAQMLRALALGDVETVVAVADPEIRLSFGGDYGTESFREMLGEASYRGELATALALGGVLQSDSLFVTPYTFDRFPDDVDPFEGLVALGPAVEVREEPENDGRVITTLSYEIVLYDYDAPYIDGWTPVRLSDDSLGWARDDEVRGAVDYRAIFVRRDGRWVLTMFLAGD